MTEKAPYVVTVSDVEVYEAGVYPFHDDSTPCRATVHVNGKAAFIASDDGWGGGFAYTYLNSYTTKELRALNDWAKTLDPIFIECEGLSEPLEVPYELEILIGDLIDEAQAAALASAARARAAVWQPRG